MQEPVFSCWAAKEQMPTGWGTRGVAAGTPQRRRGRLPTHLPGHSQLGDLPARHALGQACNLGALLPVVKLGQLQAPARRVPHDAGAPAPGRTRGL